MVETTGFRRMAFRQRFSPPERASAREPTAFRRWLFSLLEARNQHPGRSAPRRLPQSVIKKSGDKIQKTKKVKKIAEGSEMDLGDMSREKLFKEVKRGLYLTNTWYTRFQNYAKGDFSTIPRDGIFLIEKGEVKQSLKDLRISDNASSLLGNVAGISKERQHVHWWGEADPPSLSPYVLIKDVHITKSK